MPTAIELRQQRAAILEGLKGTMKTAERASRDLTPSEAAQYQEDAKRFDKLTEQIERAEILEARDLATAKPIPHPESPDGITFGGPGSGQRDTDMWLPTLREYRHMRATSTASAEALIPDHQADTWYDRIRARSVVLQSGPTIFPMEGATLDIPKLTGSVSVATVAEGESIPTSDPSTESIRLEPSKLAALAYVNAEALDDSAPEVRSVVQTDMERTFVGELDRQLLVGDGSGSNMTGIRNFADVNELDPFGGTDGGAPTLDELADMLGEAETALELDTGNSEEIGSLVWFMHPSIWNQIRTLKDGDQRYQLSPSPGMDARKQLFGIRVRTSSRLATDETTGGSSDTSPVILSDMSRIAVGERKKLEVKFSEDYLFDSDQVAARVIARYGIEPLEPKAVTIRPGARSEA
ncbi:phage major capsid protein [Nesterenkonia xinjiangensis]|uniref:HK97 family phage major capsid protein n=1 Tax=Nesterenkonia xinjiangensis TaxID=225327 RepID=A0A7Z0GMJ1_9MICC|nr:phage major capsid protein [Nesterenkonia xinjiangensis]NYJ78249.1 HK97 family phage major capsid protein [Nesterenkonia xinjiangensis]